MYEPWWQRVLLFPFRLIGWLYWAIDKHWDTFIAGGWLVWDLVTSLGALVEAMLHVAGRVTVNALLAVGLFVLYYQVMAELGYPQPQLKPHVETILRIFDTKVIWVVSLVFGATLGIMHLWKLKLDQRRYWDEQRERWHKEDEERRAKIKAEPLPPPTYDPPRPRPERTQTTPTMEGLRKRLDERE